MVVVVGAQMVLIVGLARVALVADGAIEEVDGIGEGSVARRHDGGWFCVGKGESSFLLES